MRKNKKEVESPTKNLEVSRIFGILYYQIYWISAPLGQTCAEHHHRWRKRGCSHPEANYCSSCQIAHPCVFSKSKHFCLNFPLLSFLFGKWLYQQKKKKSLTINNMEAKELRLCLSIPKMCAFDAQKKPRCVRERWILLVIAARSPTWVKALCWWDAEIKPLQHCGRFLTSEKQLADTYSNIDLFCHFFNNSIKLKFQIKYDEMQNIKWKLNDFFFRG